MTIGEVKSILEAKVLVGEERMEEPVVTACGSDLMSERG